MTRIHGEFLYLGPRDLLNTRTWEDVRITQEWLSLQLGRPTRFMEYVAQSPNFAFDDQGIIIVPSPGNLDPHPLTIVD